MRLRLGSVNLALLSLYFFPVWGGEAIRALTSPYHGLEDRAHATAAIYFRQLFDLGFDGLALTGHLLGGVKLVIAAAFVAYLIEFARAWATGRDADRETIDVVLILAVVGILACAVPALAFGDSALIRLYATQTLLIAGAILIIMIERQVTAPAPAASRVETAVRERDVMQQGLPVGMLVAAPPPTQTVALARIPDARQRQSADRY